MALQALAEISEYLDFTSTRSSLRDLLDDMTDEEFESNLDVIDTIRLRLVAMSSGKGFDYNPDDPDYREKLVAELQSFD